MLIKGKCPAILAILLATVLAMTALVAGCGDGGDQQQGSGEEQQSQATKPIKIGIIDAYTGAASTYTNDALDGFKMALETINTEGVLGTKIEFITRDDEFKVDKSLSWAKELVMKENVDLLVGCINSAAALAVSEYAKENQIPFLVWGSMSEKITGEEGHRYVFSMLPNTRMIGKAGAKQMAEMPYTKYWLAGSDYEYGHSVVNNFWENLKQIKPEVESIGESWWKVGETDFTPYLNAIRSAKPEVLVIGTGGADMVPALKAIKAAGLNEEIKIWVHTSTDLSTLRPLGSEAPEGVFGTNPYHYYYPDTPANKAFVESFTKAYNREPASFALNGYVTANFIAEAFRKAGAVDREKFIDAMAGLTIESPVGPVTIRDYDHQIVAPMFFGVTGPTPDKDYLIANDIQTLSGEEIIPPVEEIQKARENK